jgi:bla regulator protein BlaR1
MQTIVFNISQATATAIIHSIWQGLLIYAALHLVNLFMVNKAAAIKYKLSVLAMLGVAAWFAITFVQELYQCNWQSGAALLKGPPTQPVWNILFLQAVISRAYQSYSISYQPYLPYISAFYSTGLLLQVGRLIIRRQQLNRLKKSVLEDSVLTQQVKELARQLGVRKPPKAGLSKFTTTPCIAGYLQPIVFMPIAAYTYLSVDEVKALLLHELAHIKRNDYVVNLIQQAILTILFFNPMVWLINRSINNEREKSCDDIVVQHTGQPLLYAQTLVKVQELQAELTPFALAATGKKYYLLNRIERIMEKQKTAINPRHILMTLVLMAGSMASIAWLEPKVQNGQITVKKVNLPTLLTGLLQDTIPPPPPPPVHHKTTPLLPPPPPPPMAPPKLKKGSKPPKPPKVDDGGYSYHMNDATLDKLTAEVEKHANAISKYYDSPEFKDLQEKLSKSALNINQYYNSPEMQKMLKDQQAHAAEIEKIANNPKVQKLQQQLTQAANKVSQHYNSSEFKSLQQQADKESALLDRSSGNKNSAEYKKHKANLEKITASMQRYQTSPEVAANQARLEELSKQLATHYQNAVFNQQKDAINAISDSIKKVGTSVEIDQQTLATLQKQLSSIQSNPALLKEMAQLQQATLRMSAYQNSPAFKKRMAGLQKEAMTKSQQAIKEMQERPEQPERPEPAEKPEHKEAPEKAEPRR